MVSQISLAIISITLVFNNNYKYTFINTYQSLGTELYDNILFYIIYIYIYYHKVFA